MERLEGLEPTQKISYVLLTIEGRRIDKTASASEHAPRLTAQCTRSADAKLHLELLADPGNAAALTYFPPWHASPGVLFPPVYSRDSVTMSFLGYMKVKPARRTWEVLNQPSGELRYATPGLSSGNMEPVSYYLLYLRALPTLRLAIPEKGTLEFMTTPWIEAIRKEPLCKASGL